LIVGFISLRIGGIYLLILTLALSEILRTLYGAIEPKLALSAKNAVLFGKKFPTSQSLILVTIFLVIIMIITSNLINSPTGRAMLAMKNSTAAAQAMGISLIKYRLMAFVICTAYASLTGVLLMMVIRSADATDPTGYYALITSLNILAAVIISGYKSVWGAVVGTFIMYGIKLVVFNQIPFFAKNPLIITLVSGVLVIVIVMFYPGGLAQLLVELKGKLKVYKKKMKEAKYGKDLG
jgi:branched-chain amino acid transport system permease protein